MGIVTDLRALGIMLIIQLAGFIASLVSVLPPILAVLPIPHNLHEWGVALATCFLYLKARHRDRKKTIARRAPRLAPVPDLAPAVLPPTRAVRRAQKPAAEKHSTKTRKLAKL